LLHYSVDDNPRMRDIVMYEENHYNGQISWGDEEEKGRCIGEFVMGRSLGEIGKNYFFQEEDGRWNAIVLLKW
jgi:hypothetical protein